MRTLILFILFFAVVTQADQPLVEVFASPQDFANDSSVVVDSTMQLQLHKESADSSDPTYALSYLNSRGKRRFYNDKLFAIRVGDRYYIRERTDLFGAARFRPIQYCSYVSIYSLLTTETFSHSKDPQALKKTYYMIFMEDDGLVRPLTEPRVREALIRQDKLLYNEFSTTAPHTIEELLEYLSKICK